MRTVPQTCAGCWDPNRSEDRPSYHAPIRQRIRVCYRPFRGNGPHLRLGGAPLQLGFAISDGHLIHLSPDGQTVQLHGGCSIAGGHADNVAGHLPCCKVIDSTKQSCCKVTDGTKQSYCEVTDGTKQ